MAIFSLNIHASYACERSGVCCTSGWPIPVEWPLRPLLGVEVLRPQPDGACTLYDAAGRACRAQRAHGESALPTSCHNFPRITLRDRRGVFVTLSHYCPTAARLVVMHDGPAAIVSDPPAFPASRAYDALEATDAWPPLVKPDLLFDLDGFSAWEQFVVSTLSQSASPEAAWLSLRAAAEQLRAWTPARGPMAQAIKEMAVNQPTGVDDGGDRPSDDGWADAVRDHEVVGGLLLDGLPPPGPAAPLMEAHATWVAPAWSAWSRAICRYLAARAFGSWTAYQGHGVRTALHELRLTLSVLRVESARACAGAGRELDVERLIEAVRATDLILVHHVDRDRLMRACARAERAPS